MEPAPRSPHKTKEELIDAFEPENERRSGSVRGSLECPECGEICQPSKENTDGGFSYHCHNFKGHGLGNCLNFKIDKKGVVHF